MQETGENTSGHGAMAIVPEEVKAWNWAAFLMGPWWSIVHSVWIGLLCFIINLIWTAFWMVPWTTDHPIGIGLLCFITSLTMNIILGIKGGEWAWQHRKFESVEQYQQVQKIWAIWGIIIWILGFVLSITCFIITVNMLASMMPVQS